MFDINIYLKLLETFGFGVAQTGLVVFLLWKIATNHLRHIGDDIKTVSKDVKDLAIEVKSMKTNCTAHAEKIAKLEGKLE